MRKPKTHPSAYRGAHMRRAGGMPPGVQPAGIGQLPGVPGAMPPGGPVQTADTDAAPAVGADNDESEVA
jgi:hypothetical protein